MPILYKEWIKTRWFLLLALLTHVGFVCYSLLRIHRVASLHGADHAWIVMMTHDQVFIDPMQYIPLLTGLLLALFQFYPEMYHKCLKLTLHLPLSHLTLGGQMLLCGLCAMLVLTLAGYGLMLAYLPQVLAWELYSRILLTALPWYLAGVAAYLLTAWVVLESAWRRRVFNIVVSLLVLRVYFVSVTPCAYQPIAVGLTVFTLLLSVLSVISITRFKEGKE